MLDSSRSSPPGRQGKGLRIQKDQHHQDGFDARQPGVGGAGPEGTDEAALPRCRARPANLPWCVWTMAQGLRVQTHRQALAARQEHARGSRHHVHHAGTRSHAHRENVRACTRILWIPGGLRPHSDHQKMPPVRPLVRFVSKHCPAAEGLVFLSQEVCCLGPVRLAPCAGDYVCFGPRRLGTCWRRCCFVSGLGELVWGHNRHRHCACWHALLFPCSVRLAALRGAQALDLSQSVVGSPSPRRAGPVNTYVALALATYAARQAGTRWRRQQARSHCTPADIANTFLPRH